MAELPPPGYWPDPLSGIRTTPEMGMMTLESRGRHPAGSRPRTSRNGLELLALQADALEPLLELGELAAGVDQAMHAGPGRVRLGVDVQTDGVAGLAHGRAGLEAGAVGHHHVDLVVVRVDAFLHGARSENARRGL